MRIAYVITRADAVGGASVHVRDLARAMADVGHQVMVFTGGEGPVTVQMARCGVPFQPLRRLQRSIHPARDLTAVAELTKALRRFGPDIVSLHTAKAGWIGRVAASRLSLPAVYTPHGWPSGARFSAPAGIIFRWAEKIMASRSAAIVCVCQYEKDLALRQRIAQPDRLRVIHNGVHDVSAELLCDSCVGPARIVSVARFESPKDHKTLIRALAMIRALDWQADLVGDGPLQPQVRALADSLGVGERIQFLGYQADPAPVLARAQIFVLSSRSEGFPRSVLEAMRARLAVVASRVGGVPEALEDGVSGLLTPPGDSAAMASALAALISDGGMRGKLATRARQAYEKRFRFERTARQTLSLYREFV
ncbi:MAG TPA: glycosyltransferase family 4 protein [Bryobacteraceae bacterium]|nr:glycosyltransferase family 4 protein [Bryobacteraceae bacterium]